MHKNKLTGLLILLLLTGVSFAQQNEKYQFISNPVLQNMNSSGVSVYFDLNKLSLCTIEYGTDAILNNKCANYHWGMADVDSGIQRIRLEKLKPGTKYFYKVKAKEVKTLEPYKVIYGDSIETSVYSFITPAADESNFTFLAFNDIHNVPEYLENVASVEKDFSFALFDGDIFTDLNNEQDYSKKLLGPLSNFFAAGKPAYFIRGNHETRGGASRNLNKYIENPSGNYYYTFTRGNTFFIMLDCGEDKPDNNKYYFGLADYDNYRSKEAEWLKGVVNSKEFKKAKYKIACLHMPIKMNAGADSEGGHGMYDCSVKFAPILNKAGIDLMLSGHTHKYEIIKPGKDTNKFPVVVGGAYYDAKNPVRVAYTKITVTPKGITAVLKNIKSEEIERIEIKK